MRKGMLKFKQYYDTTYSARRIAWHHSLSVCVVEGFFDTNNVRIECSAYQALVMLALNEVDQISIKDLRAKLNIPSDKMKRELRPLCTKKYKVLKKDPANGYNESHTLSFNISWACPRKFVKIPSLAPKVTQKDRTQTDEKIL